MLSLARSLVLHGCSPQPPGATGSGVYVRVVQIHRDEVPFTHTHYETANQSEALAPGASLPLSLCARQTCSRGSLQQPATGSARNKSCQVFHGYSIKFFRTFQTILGFISKPQKDVTCSLQTTVRWWRENKSSLVWMFSLPQGTGGLFLLVSRNCGVTHLCLNNNTFLTNES